MPVLWQAWRVCYQRFVVLAALQVEAYANHLEPLVESFRYMPSFAFDMLTYAILYHLSDGRAKVRG